MMYQLIESNGKEMKEVLSNNRTVWEIEKGRKSVLIRTENLTVEITYAIKVIGIKDDWDFIEIAGIKFEKSEGEFLNLDHVTFLVKYGSKADQLMNIFNSFFTKTDVKQYKYI